MIGTTYVLATSVKEVPTIQETGANTHGVLAIGPETDNR